MRLYNTLTRSVDELALREPGRLAMYVCGPTVQGPPHFGHARAAVVPDVLRRYAEWSGLSVLHVRNITDIDDKIIARAAQEGRSAAEVAEEFSRIWERQVARLGVLEPHIVPRATGHILEMQELIAALIDRGVAYESGGDVLFSVRCFPAYGKLSGVDVDELRAGAGSADAEEEAGRKRDPVDFALWKGAKPGEPSWPSPWGRGRPGWHIECSAMATKYLGMGFDVHAGGRDLQFPHHENEIAQSEAASGEPFARHWVHNGLLNLGAEKMSKSLGNIISLEEALSRYGADTLRFFYLAAHYRSPVEFNEERLDEAGAAVERWSDFLRAAADLDAPADAALLEDARARFREAMDDDLATPRVHALLFDLTSAGHAALEAGRASEAVAAREALRELAGVLGYRLDTAVGGAAGAEGDQRLAAVVTGLVAHLLELRSEARARRDFATADAIRERLTALGVIVEDTPSGARWHLGRRAES